MRFLGNVLASIFGTLIALFLIFILFSLAVATFGEKETVTVENNSVLQLKLEDLVKDYAPKGDNPFEELFDLGDKKLSLNQILNAIENAKTDDNIKGISIETMGVNAGIAQVQAIRDKLENFKTSGKFIKAYADVYDQKSYYLSSVADSVFVNPVGSVDFKGLSSEVLYYKDFEDKYGVKMEVIRHGKYKSAVEPFLTNSMSNENRTQITEFLKSIWNSMLVDISKDRKISIDSLNNMADNLVGRNATSAIKNKLIDKAVYLDQYDTSLKMAVGDSLASNLNEIDISDYIASGKGRLKLVAPNEIAVVYAQGDIIYGKGDENEIGQELIASALKKARNSSKVKAIVLRVNSPGGSALASELIWREIELTKKKMPVVVSMGNLAASGGYYISCGADYIFAEPTTITGSIGVFGMLPNISKLANNIGINAEQVSTNSSPSYSLFEPISDKFKAVTKEGIEQVYNTFLERVATGRHKSVTAIDSIAQGHVWSGADAVKIGLVDKLGNLDDAVSYAAKLANVTDYKVHNYPSYKVDLQDKLKGFPFASSKEKILEDEFGKENMQIYNSLKQFSQLKGIQTRLPFVLQIN